jgi:hypothetical protein
VYLQPVQKLGFNDVRGRAKHEGADQDPCYPIG